jgi:hypothetical protein
MLAISLRLGITRNPEHLLRGIPLGFEYLKQEKYISGDERGGFHVAKVNLPLPDQRLRLFIQGKEVLTPKIGTGKRLTCGPSLVGEHHSARGFPQSIR